MSAVSSVNSHVLRNMIRIMKVVSPTEQSHYAVQILNCFLSYNSEQFFPVLFINTELLHMERTWLTHWKTTYNSALYAVFSIESVLSSEYRNSFSSCAVELLWHGNQEINLSWDVNIHLFLTIQIQYKSKRVNKIWYFYTESKRLI